MLILVQGWSCFSPTFQPVDFVSYYIEIAIMLVMFVGWKLIKRTKYVRLDEMDLETDRYTFIPQERDDAAEMDLGPQTQAQSTQRKMFSVPLGEKGGLWTARLKRFGMWLFF